MRLSLTLPAVRTPFPMTSATREFFTSSFATTFLVLGMFWSLPAAVVLAQEESAGETKLRTTHAVSLHNGAVIHANLVSEEADVYVLELGYGRFEIPKSRVDAVKVEANTRTVPARRSKQAPRREPSARTAHGLDRNELSKLPREMMLDEVLLALPGKKERERVLGALDALLASWEIEPPRPLDGATLEGDPFAFHARELKRWRARNRVRAENHLRRAGIEALPYLEEASLHPFELTRRAALRLIRDLGDPRAIPMALSALEDEDRWVRHHAAEALHRMLAPHVGYDAEWAPERRRWAEDKFHKAWETWVDEQIRAVIWNAVDEIESGKPTG